MFDFYQELRKVRGIKIDKGYEDLIKQIDELEKNGFNPEVLSYLKKR